MRFKDFAITTQVSLVIFIVFASLVVVLIFVETKLITDSFVEHKTALIVKDINNHASILVGSDFSLEDPARTKSIFENIFNELSTQDFLRMKVWSPAYQVVYSDDSSAIGGIFKDNTELGDALNGEVSAEISQPNVEENITEKEFKNFLEIYVPVFVSGQSKPIGVIEEYLDFTDTRQLILKTNFVLLGFITAIFTIFLSIALFLMQKLIKNPISKLKDVANAFEGGDFSKRIDFNSKNEMGQLVGTFNRMALKLKNYYADIQNEVKQKTKQLSAALDTVKENNQELEKTKKSMLNVLEDLRAEKGLAEESKARDGAILLSIGDGIVAVDINRRIMIMNKVAEKLLGWKINEAIGKLYDEVISLEDERGTFVPVEKRPLAKVLSSFSTTTTTTTTELYLVSKNKIKFPVAITVSPIVFNNRTFGAVEVFRDITKEKEIDRTKTEFISIASHQLRTPLAAIFWLVDSLKASFSKKQLDSRQEGYINDLSFSTDRAVKLVEDLLRVSRIQLGTSVAEEQKINLSDFMTQFINDMRSYATIKNHEIILKKIDSKCPEILIDPKILDIIMQNLVSNAIDYSPGKSVVSVVITQDNEMTKISVTNQGPSIPPDEQNNLFKKFYRGESAKKLKISGTGLGLFIVKSFVEKLGGQIGFESEEGKETVFWFTVPCVCK